jgi:hypothetical protein
MAQVHKIGRVCVNPPGKDKAQDKNLEWVEVVVSDSGNLSGHTLQHLANPKTSKSHWLDYFVFPSTAKHPPRTFVRVHSGGGRPHYDSQGIYHYYVAGEHGQGRWWFNNSGDIIRLLDEAGSEVSRRELQGDECEANQVSSGGGGSVVVPPLVTPTRSYGN